MIPVPMSGAGTSSSNVAGKEDTRIVSLLIRAIETSPSNKLTLAEINEKLVELNPSLTQRQSDWKGTVRHTLSMSTMFKKLNNERPTEWTIDPNGDRSTHKNRRKGQAQGEVSSTSLKGKKRITKRLGTTLRRREIKSSQWSSKSNQILAKEMAAGVLDGARGGQRGTIGRRTISVNAPTESDRNIESQDLASDPFQPSRRYSGDFFTDDKSRLQVNNKTTLPSQFIDTTREFFPPIPRLDTVQRIHSQSSSSISISQSQSTSNQSQSQ